jgi:hypothetical protein
MTIVRIIIDTDWGGAVKKNTNQNRITPVQERGQGQ